MQEFINLHQGGMSVKEYALKFTYISKYPPSIVANSRAKMNKFLMGMSDMIVSNAYPKYGYFTSHGECPTN